MPVRVAEHRYDHTPNPNQPYRFDSYPVSGGVGIRFRHRPEEREGVLTG
jgi:hypothetical protein